MYYYLVYIIPGVIITLLAQLYVNSTFKKYKTVPTSNGITGMTAARGILDSNGLYQVPVVPIEGELTDHFDPRSNTVSLSQPVYGVASVGAVGVAAHEVGHALQYAQDYWPIKLRSALVPVCNIGSSISVPLMVVGMVLNSLNLVWLGIILFSLAVLFQLVTLPVEFNASSRALAIIGQNGMVTQEEYKGCKKVLTAAALTYVAGLLTSLLQLLYYVAIFTGGRRRD